MYTYVVKALCKLNKLTYSDNFAAKSNNITEALANYEADYSGDVLAEHFYYNREHDDFENTYDTEIKFDLQKCSYTITTTRTSDRKDLLETFKTLYDPELFDINEINTICCCEDEDISVSVKSIILTYEVIDTDDTSDISDTSSADSE